MSGGQVLTVWALQRDDLNAYNGQPELVSLHHSAVGAMLAATDLDGTWRIEDEGTDDECWTADIVRGGSWYATEHEVQP